MTLGESVTAMERAHDKMREERDGWKQRAERLQRDLNEAVGLLEKAQGEREWLLERRQMEER